MGKRKEPGFVYTPPPSVRANFRREIEHLLGEIPAEQWADPDLRGVAYDFTPWHRMSCVTIQTRDEDPRDIGGWKYYYSAESGEFVQEEFDAYRNATTNGGLVYHKLLIEAAEAMVSLDYGKYGNPYRTAIDDGFCLNKTFLLQVYDVDQTFQFNYCEYVMARRLEQAEAGPAPDTGRV